MKIVKTLVTEETTLPTKLARSPKKKQLAYSPLKKKVNPQIFETRIPIIIRTFKKNKSLEKMDKSFYRNERENFLKKKRPELLIVLRNGNLLLDDYEDEFLSCL